MNTKHVLNVLCVLGTVLNTYKFKKRYQKRRYQFKIVNILAVTLLDYRIYDVILLKQT